MKRTSCVPLLAAAALTALLAAGCSKDHKIEVQSDTCWDGAVDGQTLMFNVCGNASYSVAGSIKCARVTKKTKTGYLRVRVDSGPWAETTDSLGTAQACK